MNACRGWLRQAPGGCRLVLAVTLSLSTSIAVAQQPTQTTAQTAAPSPPHYTIAQIVDAVEAAAASVHFEQTDSVANAKLEIFIRRLRILGQNRPGFQAIARWNADQYDVGARSSGGDTTTEVSALFRGVEQIVHIALIPRLKMVKSEAWINAALAPLYARETAMLQEAQRNNTEMLRRYEIKYGPNAPRLNGPEVVLNYLAQWIPVFGPDQGGAPSPLEMVAAYSVTDATVARSATDQLTGRIVSAERLGLRMYIFHPGWGTGGRFAQLLKPNNVSAGALVLAPKDGALTALWPKGRRVGGYVSWGEIHVGFVGGAQRRVVVGRGTQIIPYVF